MPLPYERWFEREGEKGKRQLALLRLLGFFDRPASQGCLSALRRAPIIPGLTEPLVDLARREWALTARRLDEIDLLTVRVDGSLDAHPLLREYFGQRLRDTQPEAWKAGHQRLFEHLCETTKEGNEPTLEELQPLYQAVAHGCQAGLQHWRRVKGFTGTGSSVAGKPTALENSARSVPTWEPSLASSRPRGAASRPCSRKATKPGC